MLISVGWVPPYWCPSRRLRRSRDEDRSLVTPPKIAPIPGPRPRRWLKFIITVNALGSVRGSRRLRGQRDRASDGPGERRQLPGHGDDDLVDVLAARAQLPIPLAQSHLRFPADGLDLGRQLLQPELQMPAHLGRIAIGPRAFDQRAPSVGVAGLGDAPLLAPRRGEPGRGGDR